MSQTITDHAALVIVDFQKGIDDPAWGRRNNPEAEERASDLLEKWRELGWPIVHVQHLSTEPQSPYRPGQSGCDFKETLSPHAGEMVIQKRTNNAFIDTGLQASLRDRSVTDVIIVGVLLHNSVDATVRMSGNLGFQTWLVEDATASVDLLDLQGRHWPAEDVHAISLAQLNGEYAQVVSTSQLLATLPKLVAARTTA